MPRTDGTGPPLTAAFQPPSAQPGTAKRRPGLLVRYPELPWLVLVAVLVSAAVGFGVWYLGSSRGLDQLDLEYFVSLAAVITLFGAAIGAVARVVMLSDVRLAFVIVAALIGWNIGAALAIRFVPGDFTDGDVALFDPSLVPATDASSPAPTLDATQYSGPVRCTWDAAHSRLLSVTSRRTFAIGDLPFPAQASLDMTAGTLKVERIDPENGGNVVTYSLAFAPAASATGQVYLHGLVPTVNPSLDQDTAGLVALFPDLTNWTLFWDCPGFG